MLELPCTKFIVCVVCCVQIYPSDFGLERMANEEIEGPVELTKDDGGDVETTEACKLLLETNMMCNMAVVCWYRLFCFHLNTCVLQ